MQERNHYLDSNMKPYLVYTSATDLFEIDMLRTLYDDKLLKRISSKKQSHPIILIYGTFQSNQVEPLTNDVARSLIRQLVSALKFMHLQRIVNHDVKPTDRLVTTGDIVWPLQFSDPPHLFVANSVFRCKSRAALPRPRLSPSLRLYICTSIFLMISRPADIYIRVLDLPLHRRYDLAFDRFGCRRQGFAQRLLRRRIRYGGE